MRRHVWIALAMLAGCRERMELRRVELPGFSLELPRDITAEPSPEYGEGQVQFIRDNQIVVVSWQTGSIATVDEMPVVVKTIGIAVPVLHDIHASPARSTKVNGHDATTLDATIEGVQVSFTDISCGKRSVMLGIGAARDVEELRTKVVGSFDCHPVAASEAEIGHSAPIGADDPKLFAGWSKMATSDAFTITNGQVVVVFADMPAFNTIDEATIRRLLPTIFKSFGGDWETTGSEQRHVGAMKRDFQLGSMLVDGDKMPGAMALWSCGEHRSSLIALALAPDHDALPAAMDFITQLRCSRPSDPPLPLAAAKATPAK